jgi:uncharacterized membrane protein
MHGTLLQVLGILAVIAMVLALLFRPGGAAAIVLAVVAVVAGIAVSWRDVERSREQRALAAAERSQIAATAPAPTIPDPTAPSYSRSGT